MANEPLSYWDYVKAAFKHGKHVPLLGRMPFNLMAFFGVGLLGLVNPGFWLLGAAAEVTFLAALSSNTRFQKLVQGERLLKRQRGTDLEIQKALAALDPASRTRYLRLLHECGLILGIAPASGSDQLGTLEDLRAGGLNRLLALFLRLLTSRQLIAANLAQVDRRGLEADVERLRERLSKAEADGPLARSLQATLDIETKRLANLERAQSNSQVIDAELERIEQQVRLIREETAVGAGPESLSARLDAVTQTLAETSRWMDQNAELFGSFQGEESLAGGDALPQIGESAGETPSPSTPPPSRKRIQEKS